MSESSLYDELARATASRDPRALVTIIETRGSVPRRLGAKMLVAPDGTIWGTIGGGKMEHLAIEAAKDALRTGEARTAEFPLHEKSPESFGAVCGGTVSVFVEPLGLAPRVLIVGGGHCGQALARVAAATGWEAALIDDRPDEKTRGVQGDQPGSNPKPWDEKVEVRVDRLEEALEAARLDAATALCLVNRNADLDAECLSWALKQAAWDESGDAPKLKSPFYIGMIGSKRKVGKVIERLTSAGIPQGHLDAVHAPIGMEIEAETPGEIAISIMAEIVATWRRENRHESPDAS